MHKHIHAVHYLCTILGSGHGYQQLENGLRLGHQRGDGVDDGCEFGVRFNTWNTKAHLKIVNSGNENFHSSMSL